MARVHSSMRLPLGSPAPEFSLPNLEGALYSRSEAVGRPLLVAFWCNHCPFVQHIRASFLDAAKTYLARGIAIVAINSNDPAQVPKDDRAHMQAEARTHAYPFPYLQDETGQVARRYHAACTPDFFLFDQAHKLVYRGAFDASSPGNAVLPTGAALTAAVEAVLAKEPPLAEQRPSLVCSIKWRVEAPAGVADAP